MPLSILALALLAASSREPSQATGSPPLASAAQADVWRLPPPDVVALVDAPPTPAVRLSPDARWMLVVTRPALPSIADVARPWTPLAGVRIDPATNGPYQVQFDTGIVLRDLTGEIERTIELPPGAKIGELSWSHSSRHFAFTLVGESAIELWVADVASAKPTRVVAHLNAALGRGFEWMPDGATLLAWLVPEERGAMPEPQPVPGGPTVMETAGQTTPVATFQDLLRSPLDARRFEHFARAQLAIVDPHGAEPRALGPPGLVAEAEPSPDGEHVLVTSLHRPFSYLLPFWRFPQTVEALALSGKRERLIAEVPLGENIPIEGVRTGPRDFRWKAGEPATLAWVEALDDGDPRKEVDFRDRWMALAAPFEGEPRELLKVEHRARELTWMADPTRVLASEYDRDRRWTRTRLVDLDEPSFAPLVLDDRSIHDRYGHPGAPVLEVTTQGTYVVRQDGNSIYRIAPGDSPDGARPFLARQDLATLETERLWRASPGSYESIAAIAISGDDRKPSFVSVYESPDEPPNWRLRDLEDPNNVRALTDFPDPTPALRGIKKELVTYERKDGVDLSATLYLPKGYQAGTRLPLVVWAYPQEYVDASTAGQVAGSPYRFTRFTGPSHLYFLTQGYAVLDGATMPVVGHPETMNDTFVEQIVSSAEAAIDKAVEMGVADRARVGVGGHSYGAFMTANLLAHCDLFRAGIARSGAYNRTLTPFGFQSERRTLWEAREAYTKLSPYMYADQIDEPLLLIHGEMDSNSGTFPLQSERLFQALQGTGGTARLVKLPAEDHGYRARESVLHVLAEMIEWFDARVKNAGPVEAGFHQSSR